MPYILFDQVTIQFNLGRDNNEQSERRKDEIREELNRIISEERSVTRRYEPELYSEVMSVSESIEELMGQRALKVVVKIKVEPEPRTNDSVFDKPHPALLAIRDRAETIDGYYDDEYKQLRHYD